MFKQCSLIKLCLIFVICLFSTFAQAAEKMTYLFPAPDSLIAFVPFQLAKHKGYFEQAGLDVTFQMGKGGADVATQVAVGNVQLGGGMGDTPIVVRPNGLKIRGVALLGGRGITQLFIAKGRGINTIADLKGKSIGVITFQDTVYYNLLGMLASVGLTKADVSIQAVGAGGLYQLMIAKRLDAFVGVPEQGAEIQLAGVELDSIPADTVVPAMAQSIIASDKMIAENPELIRKFVNAVLRAIADIRTDPDKAAADYISYMPQYKGREAYVLSVLKGYDQLVYPTKDNEKLGTFNPQKLESAQKSYLENKIIFKTVNVEDLYDNSFID